VARKRRIRGDRRFRKILARLPMAIREEMLVMLDDVGDELLPLMRAGAPVKTGAVRGALSKRLQRGIVRLRVGLVGKPINRRLFYAGIIEFGRKAGGRGIKRGTPKYNAGVGRMLRRPFINTPATRAIRNNLAGKITPYWDRVLARAAAGQNDE
jgi:hypothetical protein